MTCPNCERYKESAKNWRHKAYELSGHPLPWDRGDTWVGLTEAEIKECFVITPDLYLPFHIYQKIETKLKEKNT